VARLSQPHWCGSPPMISLHASYLIESHFVPFSQGRIADYPNEQGSDSRWRNDFATLSAAGTQPACGVTKLDDRFSAAPYSAVMTPIRRARLSPALDQACRGLR